MRDGIHNAIIVRSYLDDADRGFLNGGLELDYGGMHQCFGGYALYMPKGCKHYALETVAGHFIWRCMEIAGATDWNKIAGKTCRVRIENGIVKAIGHIVKDDWFCPEEDFKEAKS